MIILGSSPCGREDHTLGSHPFPIVVLEALPADEVPSLGLVLRGRDHAHAALQVMEFEDFRAGFNHGDLAPLHRLDGADSIIHNFVEATANAFSQLPLIEPGDVEVDGGVREVDDFCQVEQIVP